MLLKKDSQACLAMAANTALSTRTTRVDMPNHLVRDSVEGGEVLLEYVP